MWRSYRVYCCVEYHKGRTSNLESRDEAYGLAKEFTDRFKEKYGVTCCSALNPHPFETKRTSDKLPEDPGNTSKMLMDFITEKVCLRRILMKIAIPVDEKTWEQSMCFLWTRPIS